MHNIQEIADRFWLGVVGALIGGVTWLVRRIFTNQKQVEILEREMERRSEDIKEIKADVKQLIRKVGE